MSYDQNLADCERRETELQSAMKELAEEFRRLAAEAHVTASQRDSNGIQMEHGQYWSGKRIAFEQAAQMVEDKLGTSKEAPPKEPDSDYVNPEARHRPINY